MTTLLKELQEATGLRLFSDAPEGHEVWMPGESKPLYVAKTKPLVVAFLAGWKAGMDRAEVESNL